MNVKLSPGEKIKILNSEDVFQIMQRILMRENKIGRKKEHFWVIGLATSNKVEYIELVALGNLNRVFIKPMEIYSWALQKKSAKIILVHNHPSGDIKPSEADKDITDHLIQVGNFLHIPVIDHLIISEKSYYSYLDSGLLEKLSESKKYVLRYQEEARIKKEAQVTGEKKGAINKAKEMAKKMKKQGETIKKIIQYTGLTEKEIKSLK
jgi:DNA repair protein RadC